MLREQSIALMLSPCGWVHKFNRPQLVYLLNVSWQLLTYIYISPAKLTPILSIDHALFSFISLYHLLQKV